jgi:glutamine cyclotransferase
MVGTSRNGDRLIELRIDPGSGRRVLRVVSDAVQDIGLTRDEIFAFEQPGTIDGADHDRLFVTGKNWPKLFEIRVRGPTATQ